MDAGMRSRAVFGLLIVGAFVLGSAFSATAQNRYELSVGGDDPWVLDKRTGVICSAGNLVSVCLAPHRGSGRRYVTTPWVGATDPRRNGDVLPLHPECSDLPGGLLPLRCYGWWVSQVLGRNGH